MKPDPTRNTRAARYRAATKASGGAQINVTIGADAAMALIKLRETMTLRAAVEHALIVAAKSRAPI